MGLFYFYCCSHVDESELCDRKCGGNGCVPEREGRLIRYYIYNYKYLN